MKTQDHTEDKRPTFTNVVRLDINRLEETLELFKSRYYGYLKNMPKIK